MAPPEEEGDADPDAAGLAPAGELEAIPALAVIGPDGSVTGSPRPTRRPDERLAAMP